MIKDGKPFDTNVFFTGGAGMFLQYHDIIKPVYLYSVIKMILTKTSFGLPLNIIGDMSILSIIEWYMKRRYKNPLRCLDPMNKLDPEELDNLLSNILNSDDSIYNLSPGLNIQLMMNVYRKQHMTFPIYVYSEKEEPYILPDCKKLFGGVKVTYLHGDLEKAINKCDQNFTYILSDIGILPNLCKILLGTYSHILLARDYRYNYTDNFQTFKYDLLDLTQTHPYLRIGTTISTDINVLASSFQHTLMHREEA